MLNKNQYDITINSVLPKKWFEEANEATFFGRPLAEYSFEEISAIAAHGWKLFQDVEAKKENHK